ncbi:UvrB/UvrC motif-containing protein [soil metagenome]
MNLDIDTALQGWDFNVGVPQARMVQAADGRQVLQLRVDLGLLQLETSGRPDGARPHGCATYFHYLREQARVIDRTGQPFVLSEEQSGEADREFFQFYHRRICWLALRNYAKAIQDADHTLAFMDFVRDHSPDERYTQAHEQYRGLVLFHRTQAGAAQGLENDDAEAAVYAIQEGLEKLRAFFVSLEAEEHFDEDLMVSQLRKMEQGIREQHGIETTLQEQLDAAVAREDYEGAARLRDQLRNRSIPPHASPEY